MVISACNNTKQEVVKHYPAAFFDSAMKMANNGLKVQAMQFVHRTYDTLPKKSVADKYAYYSFMFDFYHSYYSVSKNLDSALIYSDSMLLVIEDNRMTKVLAAEYAKAFADKAEIYREQDKYPEAVKTASISRLIAEASGDYCSVAEYNSIIALAMYKQEKYLEAADYYKRSLAQATACEETAVTYHRVQSWLDNLGLAYTRANMPDSAIIYYNKAEEYIVAKQYLYSFQPRFPKIALGVVYGQKAQAYQQKGDYKTAEALYKKSISINMQKGYDNQFATDIKLYLARLYIETNRLDTVLPILTDVRASLDAGLVQYDETGLTWVKLMWDYYRIKKDDAQVNIYLNRYVRFDDSLKAKRKALLETNTKSIFSDTRIEIKTTLLSKANVLKRNYLIGLTLFIIIVLSMALVIRQNWMKATKRAARMRELNENIRQQGVLLEDLLTQLEIKNNEKDRIMRIVAHDLRNPLSSINILINNFSGSDAADKTHFLQIIRLACSDSLGLVNEILTMQPGDAEMQLNRHWVDIDALVKSCVELMQITAAKKNQYISLSPLGKRRAIMVDAEKIRRVIGNIISNAIKFSNEGKEIKVAIEEKAESFQITVEDQGIGIPAKNKDKVFDLFTTARRVGTKGEGSYGLGLSICRQIMQAHSGKICFTSEQNKGTTFYIEINKV